MAPPAYRQAVAVTQARLDELVQKAGVARVRGMFRDMQDDLERSLKRSVRSGSQFSAHVRRGLLLQVHTAMVRLAGPFGQLVKTGAAQAMVGSIRTLAEQVTALERHFNGASVPLPLLDVARFRGLIDRRVTSLLIQHNRSVARYGASAIRATEASLSTSLATGASNSEAIDGVMDAVDGTQWQAERIVRTELAWSANAGHHDGMVAQAQAMPDLWARWSEHCADGDEPIALDDRVGVDSVALHGQLARPGGLFTQPPTAPVPAPDGETIVPESLAYKTFAHPPSRPMDRAVLVPYRESWGNIGGLWTWDGGRVPFAIGRQRRAA